MPLEEIRKKLDSVDKKIIDMIAARMELVKEISQIKKDKNMPLYDKEREKEVLKNIKLYAEEQGIDTTFIEDVFKLVIFYMRQKYEGNIDEGE